MTEANAHPDLLPWAAYVVGHHPRTLRMWHEGLWLQSVCDPGGMNDAALEPINAEIRDINEALRLLALKSKVDTAILVELHRACDQFEASCQELVLSPDHAEPATTVLGCAECWDMLELSKGVVKSSDELINWCDLGTAIGKCQFSLKSYGGDYEHYPEEADDILRIAQLLRARGKQLLSKAIEQTVAKVKGSAKRQTIGGLWKWASKRFLDVSQVDRRLREALVNRAPSEPVLILNEEHLIFRGERLMVSELSPSERVCLQVLVEYAGTPIPRDIMSQRTKVPDESLTSVISRLRSKLERLGKKSLQKGGGKLLRRVEQDLIPRGNDRRLRGSEERCGFYMLNLDPGLVRLEGHRRPDGRHGHARRSAREAAWHAWSEASGSAAP